MSLSSETLELLKEGENLLAFSGGTDSAALFHLLLNENITFDIIHVNYNTRVQSYDEEHYAKSLSRQHNKKCYIQSITLQSSNFEHNARNLRYSFFDEIMKEQSYSNLITAHQLNDRLEWFLMQLCKGAGLNELLGMQSITAHNNYNIVRPILHVNSEDILSYLNSNSIIYFLDESNNNTKFKRNRFREDYASPIIKEHSDAIAKSFEFLQEDLNSFYEPSEVLHVNELFYFKTATNRRSTLIEIDKTLKRCGYLMHQSEKILLKDRNTVVIGRRFVVNINSSYCFIAPYVKTVMDKVFKERCRVLRIEPKLRGYLYENVESFQTVELLLKG
ncbi:MAG: tRNA lysidine(34) synthetase TilS [Campylobacterota bacterium]|nr:tRNA lysidine(34) synthetase TilS [Campylobacterota bacterium]